MMSMNKLPALVLAIGMIVGVTVILLNRQDHDRKVGHYLTIHDCTRRADVDMAIEEMYDCDGRRVSDLDMVKIEAVNASGR